MSSSISSVRSKNAHSVATPFKKDQLTILQAQMKTMTESALPKLWTQLSKSTIQDPVCEAYVRESCLMQDSLLGEEKSGGGKLRPILDDLIRQSCRLKVLDGWVHREAKILQDAYNVIVEGLVEEKDGEHPAGLRAWLEESNARKVDGWNVLRLSFLLYSKFFFTFIARS
jgi:hypothetical protein